MPSAPALNAYNQLVKDISTLYEDARRGQLRFAWEVGRLIVEIEQKGALRAKYGANLLRQLSEDLTAKYGGGFSVDNLQIMRRLFIENPKYEPARILSLTHYAELFRVKDRTKRKDLEKRAEEGNLTKYELRELIRKETGGSGRKSGKAKSSAPVLPPLIRPTPESLKLHTYKLAKPEVAALKKVARDEVLVDCGFFSYRPVKKSALEGLLTDTPSYAYSAIVERVIDGDTLVALIDTGFENILEERLRLRGIDTPELGTPEGERAKQFVQKLLPVGAAIVFKSKKSTDPHGRFVADVFYGANDPDAIIAGGEYLNQVLLDKGYAERMKE